MSAQQFAQRFLGKKVRYNYSSATTKEGEVVGFLVGSREPCLLVVSAGWGSKLDVLQSTCPTVTDWVILWKKHQPDQMYLIWALDRVELVDAPRALDMKAYPHKCYCGAAAYLSAQSVECSSDSCRHYKPHWLPEPPPAAEESAEEGHVVLTAPLKFMKFNYNVSTAYTAKAAKVPGQVAFPGPVVWASPLPPIDVDFADVDDLKKAAP